MVPNHLGLGRVLAVVGVDLRVAVAVDVVIVVALVAHDLGDVVLDGRCRNFVGFDGSGVSPEMIRAFF